VKARNLLCPYCETGTLDTLDEWQGYGYSEHKAVTGFKCKNPDCAAEWSKNGKTTRAPRVKLEDS
jgi:hypothetical protein